MLLLRPVTLSSRRNQYVISIRRAGLFILFLFRAIHNGSFEGMNDPRPHSYATRKCEATPSLVQDHQELGFRQVATGRFTALLTIEGCPTYTVDEDGINRRAVDGNSPLTS